MNTHTILIQASHSAFLVECSDQSVEVNAAHHPDLPPGAEPTGALSETITDKILTAKDAIVGVLSYVKDAVDSAVNVQEVSVEFSLAFKGAVGLPIVVSKSMEGALKISAKWTRPTRTAG